MTGPTPEELDAFEAFLRDDMRGGFVQEPTRSRSLALVAEVRALNREIVPIREVCSEIAGSVGRTGVAVAIELFGGRLSFVVTAPLGQVIAEMLRGLVTEKGDPKPLPGGSSS